MVKFFFREPTEYAGLSDPRVPEHEQPEQNVVLFSHDEQLVKP